MSILPEKVRKPKILTTFPGGIEMVFMTFPGVIEMERCREMGQSI